MAFCHCHPLRCLHTCNPIFAISIAHMLGAAPPCAWPEITRWQKDPKVESSKLPRSISCCFWGSLLVSGQYEALDDRSLQFTVPHSVWWPLPHCVCWWQQYGPYGCHLGPLVGNRGDLYIEDKIGLNGSLIYTSPLVSGLTNLSNVIILTMVE